MLDIICLRYLRKRLVLAKEQGDVSNNIIINNNNNNNKNNTNKGDLMLKE